MFVDSGVFVLMVLFFFMINYLLIMVVVVKFFCWVFYWFSGVMCLWVEEKVVICDLLVVEFMNEEFVCFMYVVDV